MPYLSSLYLNKCCDFQIIIHKSNTFSEWTIGSHCNILVLMVNFKWNTWSRPHEGEVWRMLDTCISINHPKNKIYEVCHYATALLISTQQRSAEFQCPDMADCAFRIWMHRHLRVYRWVPQRQVIFRADRALGKWHRIIIGQNPPTPSWSPAWRVEYKLVTRAVICWSTKSCLLDRWCQRVVLDRGSPTLAVSA